MIVSRITCLVAALFWVMNPSALSAEPEVELIEEFENKLRAKAVQFEVDFRDQVGKFLNSLDESQQKECLQPMNLKTRWHKQYTGGKREGIQIKKLNAKQKESLQTTLKLVLSDEGWKMAEAVAKQDGEQGLDKYYIACFGDPRNPDEPFAFRLCEHHLTIVHLVIKGGELTEFGPILLGANPPVLWQKDEKLLIDVWKTHIKNAGSQKLLEKGSGISSKLMKGEKGMLFNDLHADTKSLIKVAWLHRNNIFSPVIQFRLDDLQKARGGWEKSRVAFYNQAADKRSKDGGRWDFKCALPGMVWDFESSRGHIHMSLCIHPLKKK